MLFCLQQGEGEEGPARGWGQSQQPLHLGGQGELGLHGQVRARCHRLSEDICRLGQQVSPNCLGYIQIRRGLVFSGLLVTILATDAGSVCRLERERPWLRWMEPFIWARWAVTHSRPP